MKKLIALLLFVAATASGAVVPYLGDKVALSNDVYSVATEAATENLKTLERWIIEGVYTARSATNVNLANSAWVAVNGDNATGTVGDSNAPYLNISNAVRAVASGGFVFVGPGEFTETWIPLHRTNQTGVSLIGSGAGSLTNQGALVVLGHSSQVLSLSISNGMDWPSQQAAIGYDTGRAGQIAPTNIILRSLVLRGNSDCGYFNEGVGGLANVVWADSIDALSKWDAWFINPISEDGFHRISRSRLRVIQPDGYTNLLTTTWAGNARTILVAAGSLLVENSIVTASGGDRSTNIVTALYSTQGFYGPTNWNSTITATGPSAANLSDVTIVSEPLTTLKTWLPRQ